MIVSIQLQTLSMERLAQPDLEQGAWKIGGVTITITGNELNILDGNTSATATVLREQGCF